MKKQCISAVLVMVLLPVMVPIMAADYAFKGPDSNDFYQSTAYEITYGSEYNYGGLNVVGLTDHSAQLPGIVSSPYQQSAETGGATAALSYNDGATYSTGSSFTANAAYTPISQLLNADGSIGTVSIPSLSIKMKVYEGTTDQSMNKGLGHFAESSGWEGNVAVSGHNRGAKYNIGSIKDMKVGDIVEYTTLMGTQKYAVTFVGTISSTDWSYVSSTADNRITLITCLADQPSLRVCVQATEVK